MFPGSVFLVADSSLPVAFIARELWRFFMAHCIDDWFMVVYSLRNEYAIAGKFNLECSGLGGVIVYKMMIPGEK
jgi:hypothetical protein